MKRILSTPMLIGFTIVGLLSSCQKDDVITPTPDARPQSFSEIKAPASFNWATTKDVHVKIQGLNLGESVFNTLTLSVNGGANLISERVDMSQTQEYDLQIPADAQTLKLTFGKMEKSLPVSNTINTNFVIDQPTDYVE